ncbi:hypothetical protein [Lysinibacter cavernae]|uniref:Uncharacterized protein n=1 Tax=Lysinibacter cavernae TaxID=1640652 RepID=A0A7X5TTT7_9MICO|nr:hypothetical protein [Lysinibacter cavernae]NIH52957.1 hypothetical protein [Lysinibacter cavernae]
MRKFWRGKSPARPASQQAPAPEHPPLPTTGRVQYEDSGEVVPHDWPADDGLNFVAVVRKYGVHYSLTEAQWEQLGSIYQALPGSVTHDQGYPCWFGEVDSPTGWLDVSVEPSGLLVSGRLPISQWLAWDSAFRDALDGTDFPRIDYGYE